MKKWFVFLGLFWWCSCVPMFTPLVHFDKPHGNLVAIVKKKKQELTLKRFPYEYGQTITDLYGYVTVFISQLFRRLAQMHGQSISGICFNDQKFSRDFCIEREYGITKALKTPAGTIDLLSLVSKNNSGFNALGSFDCYMSKFFVFEHLPSKKQYGEKVRIMGLRLKNNQALFLPLLVDKDACFVQKWDPVLLPYNKKKGQSKG